VENDIATVGILPSTLEKNLTTEALNKLQRYSCDPSKAAEMLQSMGWKKNSGGVWQDKEGKTYNFIIAANSGWGTQGINAASEIAQQLSKFGFPTEAKSVDSSVEVDRTKKGEYDMAIDFVDMTWNVSNPYSCLNTYFNDVSAEALLPRDSNDKLSLKLTDYNGQEFDVRSTVLSLRYENDPAKYKETVSRLVWAANDYAMAINLYQTVMCIWQNFTTQKGLPMEGEIASFNGMMPLPRNAEEQEQVAVLNRGYAFYAEEFVRGQVRPK
jgi:peptide/nickel transport system substrate-binding protein